jgi:hypothetical protein
VGRAIEDRILHPNGPNTLFFGLRKPYPPTEDRNRRIRSSSVRAHYLALDPSQDHAEASAWAGWAVQSTVQSATCSVQRASVHSEILHSGAVVQLVAAHKNKDEHLLRHGLQLQSRGFKGSTESRGSWRYLRGKESVHGDSDQVLQRSVKPNPDPSMHHFLPFVFVLITPASSSSCSSSFSLTQTFPLYAHLLNPPYIRPL